MEKLTEEQARELLNEYHDNTGSCVCREAIDTFIAKKFPKLEVGKWYKSTCHTTGKMLIFPQFISKARNLYGYGFDAEGNWRVETEEKSDHCLCNDVAAQYLVPASDKEVEEALIAEAKRRGFKKGVKICQYWRPKKDVYILGTGKFIYRDKSLSDFVRIFKDGKWAEIVSEPDKEEMTLDQIEKELGRKIKIVSLPDKE